MAEKIEKPETVGEFVADARKRLSGLTEGLWSARKHVVVAVSTGVVVADFGMTSDGDKRPSYQREQEATSNATFAAHARNQYPRALNVIVWQSQAITEKDKELQRVKRESDLLWVKNEEMFKEIHRLREEVQRAQEPPKGRSIFNDTTPVP